MDNSLIQRVIDLALENVRGDGGPFAALVAKDGVVIAIGANQVTRSNDPTAHAEIVAIREACRVLGAFHLDGCDFLYAPVLAIGPARFKNQFMDATRGAGYRLVGPGTRASGWACGLRVAGGHHVGHHVGTVLELVVVVVVVVIGGNGGMGAPSPFDVGEYRVLAVDE